MKKLHIYLLFILFVSISSYSQRVNFGFRYGNNIGSPIPYGHIPEGAKSNLIVGYNAGIFINYKINDNFGLRFWVSNSKKAVEFETKLVNQYYEEVQEIDLGTIVITDTIRTIFNGTAQGKFDNIYWEFPLMFSYHFSDNAYVLVGPYVAYLMNSHTYAKVVDGYYGNPDNPTKVEGEYQLDYKDKMNKWDYGLNLGLEYDTGCRFIFDAVVAAGFNSVFVKEYKTIDYEVPNFYLEISASYILNYKENKKIN